MKKRLTIGLVVGATVFAAVFAMAATLGITSDDLAAGDEAVGQCDDAVTTSYTTAYDGTTNNRYEIASVTVGGIDSVACDGQDIQVTVGQTGATPAFFSSATEAVAASTHTFTFTDPGRPSAALANDIHVLIAN
jgi:hypothetical protein